LIIDPKPISFLVTPDNGLPAQEYNGEEDETNTAKDTYLLDLAEDLEGFKK